MYQIPVTGIQVTLAPVSWRCTASKKVLNPSLVGRLPFSRLSPSWNCGKRHPLKYRLRNFQPLVLGDFMCNILAVAWLLFLLISSGSRLQFLMEWMWMRVPKVVLDKAITAVLDGLRLSFATWAVFLCQLLHLKGIKQDLLSELHRWQSSMICPETRLCHRRATGAVPLHSSDS